MSQQAQGHSRTCIESTRKEDERRMGDGCGDLEVLAGDKDQEGRFKAIRKREVKDPWHETGPLNHFGDKVNPDQYVVNREVSLSDLKVLAGSVGRVGRRGPREEVVRRVPGKGNSNSHGARPVHLIISMIKWIRTSRLSIKQYLSRAPSTGARGQSSCRGTRPSTPAQRPARPA